MAKRIDQMNETEVRAAMASLDDRLRAFEQSCYVPDGNGGISHRTSKDTTANRLLVYGTFNRTAAKYRARLAALAVNQD